MKRNWVVYFKPDGSKNTIAKLGPYRRSNAFWVFKHSRGIKNDRGVIAIEKFKGLFKRIKICPHREDEFADYLLAKQQLLE